MTLFEVLPPLRRGATRHLDRTIWPVSACLDEQGQLCVGGVAVAQIAAQFGTPSYLVDELDFRSRIRCYRATLPDAELIYAAKALLSIDVAGWALAEGAGVDVCSGGELAIALAGAVPPARMVLHGSATTPGEMHDAVAAGVGRIVIDSPSQIALLAGWATRQRVLVRVIPNVHAGAGVIEQKFGFALADGQATAAVKRVLDQPRLQPVGLHCQLGSQLTDAVPYGVAIRQMIATMAEIRDRHQAVLTELSLGGGHAIPYLSGDPQLDLRAFGAVVDAALGSACAEHGYPRPKIVIEPGRAIAARAGITLYRVISVKRQPGGRTFVAVDGDMIDNPRVPLPGTKYTVALTNRNQSAGTAPVTVVGRHCEADSEIARDVELPAHIRPGDLLAVACATARRANSCAGRPLPTCWPATAAGPGTMVGWAIMPSETVVRDSRRGLPSAASVRVTAAYAAILLAVYLVLTALGPRAHQLAVSRMSTNVHNLGRGHLGTLIGSAFVNDGGHLLLWLPGLVCLLAVAELMWCSRGLLLTFAVGHIGTTLIVAVGLVAAIETGQLPFSVARASDVGISYGAVCVLGAFTASIPARWRGAWAGGWLGTALVVAADWDFTAVGHVIALLLGIGLSFRLRSSTAWTPLHIALLVVGTMFGYLLLTGPVLLAPLGGLVGAVIGLIVTLFRRRPVLRSTGITDPISG